MSTKQWRSVSSRKIGILLLPRLNKWNVSPAGNRRFVRAMVVVQSKIRAQETSTDFLGKARAHRQKYAASAKSTRVTLADPTTSPFGAPSEHIRNAFGAGSERVR